MGYRGEPDRTGSTKRKRVYALVVSLDAQCAAQEGRVIWPMTHARLELYLNGRLPYASVYTGVACSETHTIKLGKPHKRVVCVPECQANTKMLFVLRKRGY